LFNGGAAGNDVALKMPDSSRQQRIQQLHLMRFMLSQVGAPANQGYADHSQVMIARTLAPPQCISSGAASSEP
jgi:hypothetical protein